MNQYQQLLDAAVGTPPPSGVDVDAVISRQRRRTRFLRFGTAGSAAAVVLTVAVVFAVLPRSGSAPGDPTVKDPSGQGPPGLGAPGGSEPAGDAARMTHALRQALTKALPGAEYLPNRLPDEEPVDALVFAQEGAGYKATAEIRDAAGIGSVYVTVGDEDGVLGIYGKDACEGLKPKPRDVDVLDCKVRTAGDGTLILLITTKMKKFTRHRVALLRKDGESVVVEVDNKSAKDEGAVARRPQPHLTRNQALTLAQNPAFTRTG